MTQEEMRALMLEAGPLCEAIIAVLEVGEAMWTFRYAGFEVDLVHVAQERRLVMTVAVVASAPEHAAAVNRMLLLYNALWRDTGSVRAALTSVEGDVALICDVFTEGLTAELVTRMAGNLVDKAASWKAIIEAGAPHEGALAAAQLERTGR